MAKTRVAVFVSAGSRRKETFLSWASLIGPQVALLHPSRDGYTKARDGTRCRSEIRRGGVVKETIAGSLRSAASLGSAPLFVFLDSISTMPVTPTTDPRFSSSDRKEVAKAMWDFVNKAAQSDPKVAPSSDRLFAKPWWCKLFRKAPGC